MVIDEAGHAMEPEALNAIAGVLAKDGGQVILAGDPEQLGPVLRSPKAIDHGLGEYFRDCCMDALATFTISFVFTIIILVVIKNYVYGLFTFLNENHIRL